MKKKDIRNVMFYSFTLASMTYAGIELTPTASASFGICCTNGTGACGGALVCCPPGKFEAPCSSDPASTWYCKSGPCPPGS
jgi:hypothetical protein